jgi:hypothetical protein
LKTVSAESWLKALNGSFEPSKVGTAILNGQRLTVVVLGTVVVAGRLVLRR